MWFLCHLSYEICYAPSLIDEHHSHRDQITADEEQTVCAEPAERGKSRAQHYAQACYSKHEDSETGGKDMPLMHFRGDGRRAADGIENRQHEDIKHACAHDVGDGNIRQVKHSNRAEAGDQFRQ